MANAQKNINFTINATTLKLINGYLTSLEELRTLQLEKSALNKKLADNKITIETHEKKITTLNDSIKTTNKSLSGYCNELVSDELYNVYLYAFNNGIDKGYTETTKDKNDNKTTIKHNSFTGELMNTFISYGCILGNEKKQATTASKIFRTWCTPSRAVNSKLKNEMEEFELLKPYGKKAFKKHFTHAFIKFIRDNKKTIVYDSNSNSYVTRTFN